MTKEELMAAVKYDDKGLVPVICQDVHSKKVRMLAYMNQESLRQTLETGKMTYWSRSRQAFWVKGETSGNFQYLKGLAIDCDGDTLLAIIEQVNGISCHTGHATCFYREIEGLSYTINRTLNDANNTSIFKGLEDTIEERRQHPKEGSYTNYLIDKGLDKICKKVGEETTETIIAAKNVESDNNPKTHQELIGEIADVMYHLSVMMNQTHVTWEDVETELKNRHQ